MVNEDVNVPVVPVPAGGVDGRVALATAIHAAPGVYAVLVGSGMSSAAGIPTGWQVVQDLIRKIAIAEGAEVEELGDAPEIWWTQQGRPDPRYDTILTSLASTDAARQSLLRGYFDPPPTDGGQIQPTAGHEALAWLCATGRVRLILTTNFDRLIERALDAYGITPQVVSSVGALGGMTPLPHPGVTVVKLHGDYATSGLRNTPEELGAYPSEQNAFLERVFDEFGLVVVGWSAEYDGALAEALYSSPSRRYPMFWATFNGHVTESARRLIDLRRAQIIDTSGADDFLPDLSQRVERLDQGAARRGRPTPLRSYLFPPDQTSVTPGWAVMPLLHLRAVAAVGAVTQDSVGIIRPEQRDALVQTLRTDAVTQALRELALAPPGSASSEPPAPGSSITPIPLTDWVDTPGGYQSIDNASYRLGGDGAIGVSALASVQGPSFGITGSIVFKLDVGLSLAGRLGLGDVARLLRDGLVLTTAVLPDALAELLPSDANVFQAEFHVMASPTDGNQRNRPNELDDRIDLSPLGSETRTTNAGFLAYASRVPGPLTQRDAAEIVADGIDYIALTRGFLDPREGIAQLRLELGLPPSN
jgi:hypothetical protein